MNGVIRKDANNHIIPGLQGMLVTKTVTYDEEAVSDQAVLSTALTGNNNDIDFTAVPYGAKGNNISIAYVDPGGTTATLGVVVTGNIDDGVLITVNLGRAAGAINTTGDLLKAALDSADVSDYVTYADKAGNDGSGLVTALAETPLAGGAGRTLFEVDGDVEIQLFAKAVDDFSGSGALAVQLQASSDFSFIEQATMADIDGNKFIKQDNTPSYVGDFPDLALISSDNIVDVITTDTISGTIIYYAFWYPLSDDGNVVATNE